MIELSEEEKTQIEKLVFAHYYKHKMWDRRKLPLVIKRVTGWFTGEEEIYDSSLMDELNLGPEVEKKRILNIGDCGLSSSLDFIASGSEAVCAVDFLFFGSYLWNSSELDALITMKAKRKGIDDVSGLSAKERFIGGSSKRPFPQIFETTYFFFPPVAKIATFSEKHYSSNSKENFTDILDFVYNHLNIGGFFKVITEVEPQYLNEVQFPGFERSQWRKDGKDGKELYTRAQLMAQSDFDVVRPASSLGLTVVNYRKV